MNNNEPVNDMRLPRELLSSFESSLNAFLASNAKYQVVKSVSSELSNYRAHSSVSRQSASRPRTLLILDASFNPPTRAHLSLATSALQDFLGTSKKTTEHASASASRQSMQQHFPPPYRFVFLFSVHNADKSPSPAAFSHRLALMYASALDMLTSLSSLPAQSYQEGIGVDVAITKEPYYSDKSAAIDASAEYRREESSRPHHVHLIGYDTFVRFLNPKYYSNFDPPLSALDPYFKYHGLRMTLRAASSEEAHEQEQTWKDLSEGNLIKQGGKPEWAERIEPVRGEQDSIGVSSTAVRKACESHDWETVETLCPPQVSAWIKVHSLYQESSSGKI